MKMAGTEPSDTDQRDLGSTILRSIVAVSPGSWFMRSANFLLIIYAIRMLCEAELGRYATIVAFVVLISVFSELGTAEYVERPIARGPLQEKELLRNPVVLCALLAVVGNVGVFSVGFQSVRCRNRVRGVYLLTGVSSGGGVGTAHDHIHGERTIRSVDGNWFDRTSHYDRARSCSSLGGLRVLPTPADRPCCDAI